MQNAGLPARRHRFQSTRRIEIQNSAKSSSKEVPYLLIGVSVELEKAILGRDSADELSRFPGLTMNAESVLASDHRFRLLVHLDQRNGVQSGQNASRESHATLAERHVHCAEGKGEGMSSGKSIW